MILKVSLISIVIISNIIACTFARDAYVTGTLTCKGRRAGGFKVDLCDGLNSTQPIATTISDDKGFIVLNGSLTDTNNNFRVTIHHNCTFEKSKIIRRRNYTIIKDYGSIYKGEIPTTIPAHFGFVNLTNKESNSNIVDCGIFS